VVCLPDHDCVDGLVRRRDLLGAAGEHPRAGVAFGGHGAHALVGLDRDHLVADGAQYTGQ
jgi:hypothetical protein